MNKGDRAEASIVDVETYALAVPLSPSIGDSQVALTHWTVPVVEVTDSEGRVGTGIGGLHAGAELLCGVVDRHYAPLLADQPVSAIRRLWHEMYASELQWVGRAGVAHMALALVDIALWDLHAQAAGMPLWKLLGGHHDRLKTYDSDAGWLNFDIDELTDRMSHSVRSGWRAVKMKVGLPDLAEDIRRVRAVRATIGSDIDLYCDANKAWSYRDAQRAVTALEEFDIGWIEEPLHPDDVLAHSRLRRSTAIPIALGESLYTRQAFRDFMLAEAVTIVQVDVTRVGGITEYLEIQALAQAFDLDVIPHAGDMMVVHQHLAASAFGSVATIEHIPWTHGAFTCPVEIDGADVLLPAVPGAATRIHDQARRDWRIPGVGSAP